MNQSQIKYARERAEAIFKDRCRAIEKKHTTEAVVLTDDEKIVALKAGRFTSDKKETGNWQWRIKFTDERERRIATVPRDKETAALQTAYRELMDELILGDNEKALQLLTAFEKGNSDDR